MVRENKWAVGLIVIGIVSLLTGLGLALIATGVLLIFHAPRRQPERWVAILSSMVLALILLPLLLFVILPAEWTDTDPNGSGAGYVVFYVPLYLAFTTAVPLTVQTCVHMRSLRRRFRVVGLLPITLLTTSIAVSIAIHAPLLFGTIMIVGFFVWFVWAWRCRPNRLFLLRRIRRRQSARAKARAERRSTCSPPSPRPAAVPPVPAPRPPVLPRTRPPKFGIIAWVVLVLLLLPAGFILWLLTQPIDAPGFGAIGVVAMILLLAGLVLLVDIIASVSCALASLHRREKHPWLAVSCLAFWGIAGVVTFATIVYFVHFHGDVAN